MIGLSFPQQILIWILRIRRRRGYGVHSPFAFNLLTWVVYEKMNYYAYDELLRARESLSGQKRMARSPKTDELLFRLVNWVQPHTIIELGTSIGLTTLYLRAATQKACILSIDEPSATNQTASTLFSTHAANGIDFRVGEQSSTLIHALDELPTVDFLLLPYLPIDKELLERCLAKAGQNSLYVVEGIHRNRAAKRCWKEIVADPNVRVTFDLYGLGLIFFDKSMIKQHYVINF